MMYPYELLSIVCLYMEQSEQCSLFSYIEINEQPLGRNFRGIPLMAINPEESLAPMQMPVSHVGSTLQDLLAETCQYLAPEDMERIERAYELANQAHMGVHRRSGEAYIQHPLEVA